MGRSKYRMNKRDEDNHRAVRSQHNNDVKQQSNKISSKAEKTMAVQPAKNKRFDIQTIQQEKLAAFETLLAKHRYWHLVPNGETEAAGVLDSEEGVVLPPLSTSEASLKAALGNNAFMYFRKANGKDNLATLESTTKLLWNNESSTQQYNVEQWNSTQKQKAWGDIDGWRLPTYKQLTEFASRNGNPFRKDQAYKLISRNNDSQWFWLHSVGRTDLEAGKWNSSSSNEAAFVFGCNSRFDQKSLKQIVIDFYENNWSLCSTAGAEQFAYRAINANYADLSKAELLKNLFSDNVMLIAISSKDDSDRIDTLVPSKYFVGGLFENIDYNLCRLPKLDKAQQSDIEKGLWELWGQDAAVLRANNLVAKDPMQDVKRTAVAIDFGTSSTVVAMGTSTGGRELLRIGVRDFYKQPEAKDFENPTVLECLDFEQFNAIWQNEAYRPQVTWEMMRASHEAQANYRDNPGDTAVLASIMPKLKQWAMRSEQSRVRLTDRKGYELELPAYIERNPVRGQPLNLTGKEPFDPVELYAWYLGLAINWRNRGIFLNYYLSFPAKYSLDVKNKILASFRRGLQRSLPETLIQHYPEVLNDFSVEELASEPSAYAAAALSHLGIELTDEGVPYAVFDFGGGTSDFDYGLLRWADDDEEAKGYESVYEQLASSGDNFLGGENLLEHLVYESFKQNINELRKHKIQFTRPLNAKNFAGSEAFLAPTQAAQTNSVMLAAKLRDFLESDAPNLDSQIRLDLINANGEKQTVELSLDAEALDALLLDKIRAGVEIFLQELSDVQQHYPSGETIHILMAGNGSRSRHLKALFDQEGEHWQALCQRYFGNDVPDIQIHAPLPMDDNNPHAPTAKTGVALGLLRVASGENALLINKVQANDEGQAPFAWNVGRMRRGKFSAQLSRSAAYEQWQEIGVLQQGVFNLYASKNPRAEELAEGHAELIKHRLEFRSAEEGEKLYAMPVNPNKIKLAVILPGSNTNAPEYVQELELKY